LLIRRGESVVAWRNSCPHRGIRLEWQPNQFLDYEKQFIQCATHGALFGIDDGICIAGPCPGEQLEALPVEVRDGEVWLTRD
jgi:nitrite reductase/ring-hydroxylating ferredoxin subunit